MRTRLLGSSSRALRTVAISALAGSLALGAALLSWPTGAGATGSPSVQTQAEEIASQIQADGVALDQLDASYSAAVIRYQQLAARQETLRKEIAATDAEVSRARSALEEQAILAYITGGSPQLPFQSGKASKDPSLMLAYAEIISHDEKDVLSTYKSALTSESSEQDKLASSTRSAAIALTDERSAQSQAAATLQSRQQELAQLKGPLAQAVQADEAQDQQAQQNQERALLASEGEKLPGAGTSGAGTAELESKATAPPATAPPATKTTTAKAPTTKATTKATADPPSTEPATSTTTVAQTGTSGGAGPPQAPGVSAVLAYARAQLGKPYAWAGAGPDSFDCSGLVMMAWRQAGIDFPHLAQDQYNLTERIPLADLEPGDLVFYGTPTDVYHVGIYVGGGDMIDAPETGQNVSVQSIYWTDLLGGGRVTASS